MTNIATLDDLRNLPLGTNVQVAAGTRLDTMQTWSVTQGGLDLAGRHVPFAHFGPALAVGAVTTVAAPAFIDFEIGQWFTSGMEGEGTLLHVGNVREDESADLFRIYPDGSINMTNVGQPGGDWRLVENPQVDWSSERVLTFNTMTSLWQGANRRAGHVAAPVPVTTGPDLDSLGESLRDVVDRFDDEDDKERVRTWMREQGMPIPPRMVNTRITIRGTSTVTIDDRDHISENRDVSVTEAGEAEVEWQYVIEAEVEYEHDDLDPCEDRDFFDEEWAAQYLRDNDVFYTFDDNSIRIIARSCSEC